MFNAGIARRAGDILKCQNEAILTGSRMPFCGAWWRKSMNCATDFGAGNLQCSRSGSPLKDGN